MKTRLIAAMLIVASLTSVAQAQHHTKRGAAVGGVLGAIAGGAIGNKKDKTAEGALIGGALGLITGAAIGNAKDEEIARTRAYQREMHYRWSRGVTPSEVVHLTQSGVSESVIINHVYQNGLRRELDVSDVVALHNQGVSERVISAMQKAPLATSPAPAPSSYGPSVIVEQHHYVSPRVIVPSQGYHRHHHRGHFPHHHHGPRVYVDPYWCR